MKKNDIVKKYKEYCETDQYIKNNPFNEDRFFKCAEAIGPDLEKIIITYSMEDFYSNVSVYFNDRDTFEPAVGNEPFIDVEVALCNSKGSDPMSIIDAMSGIPLYKNRVFEYSNILEKYMYIDDYYVDTYNYFADSICWLGDNGHFKSKIPLSFRQYRYISQHSIGYSSFGNVKNDKQIIIFYVNQVTSVQTQKLPDEFGHNHTMLHSTTSPTIETKNGDKFCFFRDMMYPVEWLKKGYLKAVDIMKMTNVEQRRIAMELIGWDKMLAQLGAKIVDKNKNPQIGTLYRCNDDDFGKLSFLKVKCGTGRSFIIPVPNFVATAEQANAWTYGFEASKRHDFIIPEVRT